MALRRYVVFISSSSASRPGGLHEIDLARAGRRIELERGLVVRRGKVPGDDGFVLGPGVIGQGRDDQFARQWIVSELDPGLPVEARLAEEIVLASHAADF